MRKRTSLLLLIVFVFTGMLWAAEDPFVGEWKLNPAKTTLRDEMKVTSAGPNKYTFDFGGDMPETIVTDKVVVYKSFFPRSLCRDYVSFLRELPLTTTPGKPKRGEAMRVNDRYQIDDPRFAERLWTQTGLKEAVKNPDVVHLWYVCPPRLGRLLTAS